MLLTVKIFSFLILCAAIYVYYKLVLKPKQEEKNETKRQEAKMKNFYNNIRL